MISRYQTVHLDITEQYRADRGFMLCGCSSGESVRVSDYDILNYSHACLEAL